MIDHLMLIDDDSIDQKHYKRIVTRSGLVRCFHQFTHAEKALEFLSDPANPHIDAILLDINMPRMTGFEFLDAAVNDLGSSFAHLVVVMLTTSASPYDRERVTRYDMVRDYVIKPLELAHLERIDAMLAATRQERPG